MCSPPTDGTLELSRSIAADSTGSASSGASLLKGVSLASLTAGMSLYAAAVADDASGGFAALLDAADPEATPVAALPLSVAAAAPPCGGR